MRRQQLIRAGGAAAVLAGALRIATSFWPSPEPVVALEWLYLVIDVLILFGILGVYGSRSGQLGIVGFAGCLLAVIGSAIIAGPDGSIGAVDMYPLGSLLIGLGVVCLGVASWRSRSLPRWVAGLWMVSTGAGIAGAALGMPGLFVLAGLAFGTAFVGAGLAVHRDARRAVYGEPRESGHRREP